MYLGVEGQGKLHRGANESTLGLEECSLMEGRRAFSKRTSRGKSMEAGNNMAELGTGGTDV